MRTYQIAPYVAPVKVTVVPTLPLTPELLSLFREALGPDPDAAKVALDLLFDEETEHSILLEEFEHALVNDGKW